MTDDLPRMARRRGDFAWSACTSTKDATVARRDATPTSSTRSRATTSLGRGAELQHRTGVRGHAGRPHDQERDQPVVRHRRGRLRRAHEGRLYAKGHRRRLRGRRPLGPSGSPPGLRREQLRRGDDHLQPRLHEQAHPHRALAAVGVRSAEARGHARRPEPGLAPHRHRPLGAARPAGPGHQRRAARGRDERAFRARRLVRPRRDRRRQGERPRFSSRQFWHKPSGVVDKKKDEEWKLETATHDGVHIWVLGGATENDSEDAAMLRRRRGCSPSSPSSSTSRASESRSYWSRSVPETIVSAQIAVNRMNKRVDGVMDLHAVPKHLRLEEGGHQHRQDDQRPRRHYRGQRPRGTGHRMAHAAQHQR